MSCTEFKVGDRVVVADAGDCYHFYKPGAEGVVIDQDEQMAKVRFVSGDFDTQDGVWWANHSQLRALQPYSSAFTKKAATEPTRGHTTDGGGLQQHSVGKAYPLSIVGYASGEHIVYRIENLTTDAVFGNIERPLTWDDIHTATWMLSMYLKYGHALGGIAWHPRKPKPELAGY